MKLWPHCQSHWQMLDMALRLSDWREADDEIVRLALVLPDNFTGRLPIGNTGRENVSAFTQMKIPPDLQALLEPKSD